MATPTKKTFIAAAAILKNARKHETAPCVALLDSLSIEFADMFGAANPAFDRARFLAACK